MADEYEKAIERDLQSQVSRKLKRDQLNINNPSPAYARSKMPDAPAKDVTIKCQYCSIDIPPLTVENLENKDKIRERKFRCCTKCRNEIIGPKGILDAGTHGLGR